MKPSPALSFLVCMLATAAHAITINLDISLLNTAGIGGGIGTDTGERGSVAFDIRWGPTIGSRSGPSVADYYPDRGDPNNEFHAGAWHTGVSAGDLDDGILFRVTDRRRTGDWQVGPLLFTGSRLFSDMNLSNLPSAFYAMALADDAYGARFGYGSPPQGWVPWVANVPDKGSTLLLLGIAVGGLSLAQFIRAG